MSFLSPEEHYDMYGYYEDEDEEKSPVAQAYVDSSIFSFQSAIPGLCELGRHTASDGVIWQSRPEPYFENVLQYKFPSFETHLKDKKNDIITFSDIHGDIDALIVCLRDCGKVIHKPGFDPELERDAELEYYLKMDINDTKYNRSLGYEWVESNSNYVVIIGDFIDAIRERDNPIELPDYPQIELKIIHFINALNESALLQYQKIHPSYSESQVDVPDDCGRIFKLLGNHELINFGTFHERYKEYIRPYSFPRDIPDIHSSIVNTYYSTKNTPIQFNTNHPRIDPIFKNLNYTRDNIFSYLSPGFNAYFETTGAGIMILINDNLFVHGGIAKNVMGNVPNLNQIATYNKKLLNSVNHPFTEDDFLELIHSCLFPLLETRDYYYPNGNVEIDDGDNKKGITCVDFKQRLKDLCIIKGDGFDIEDENVCITIPEHIRMFKGHCPQYVHDEATTISSFFHEDNLIEIYTNGEENSYYHGPKVDGPKVHGQKDHGQKDHGSHNQHWGITFSCDRYGNEALDPMDNKQHPQIIKVDVGMGRGQDNPTNNDLSILPYRVPQIIMIPYDNTNLILIRSKMKTMAMHMPRTNYHGIQLRKQSRKVTQSRKQSRKQSRVKGKQSRKERK